jgi:proteic killer suppression protein
MLYQVDLSEVEHLFKRALPSKIIVKIRFWVKMVELQGLPQTRKVPGYHDEPLKGNRAGQRSIRLSRAYRLIYIEDTDRSLVIVRVVEVNKHEY